MRAVTWARAHAYCPAARRDERITNRRRSRKQPARTLGRDCRNAFGYTQRTTFHTGHIVMSRKSYRFIKGMKRELSWHHKLTRCILNTYHGSCMHSYAMTFISKKGMESVAVWKGGDAQAAHSIYSWLGNKPLSHHCTSPKLSNSHFSRCLIWKKKKPLWSLVTLKCQGRINHYMKFLE